MNDIELARRYGRSDVDRFLDELTWAQAQELRQSVGIENERLNRDDIRFAFMFAVLCNKFGVSAEPEDFYYLDDLDEEDETESMTPKQQMSIIASVVGATRG